MIVNKFLNPFVHLSDRLLHAFAIGSTVFGLLVAIFFNVSFDGCIDVHFVEKITVSKAILYLIISIVILSLTLFVSGRIANPKTRFIDIVMIVLIARVPLYLLGLQNINGYGYSQANHLQKLILGSNGDIAAITAALQSVITFLIITSITGLAALVYFIILLYNGYQNATNIKKTKQILVFALTIIIAEIVAQILLSIC